MKSASSQYVTRLALGAFVILVFLLQTISLAEANLEAALTDNEENLNLEKENNIVMPTADEMISDVLGYKERVAGTDRWNDLILKVSLEENIDPVFVKCIMALESAGDENLVHYNKNSTYDSGLMQVNSSWVEYDKERLLYDHEYAIRCGIEVIKAKIHAAEVNGKVPTAYEVAWRYNGYCEQGRKYASKFVTLYSELSKNTGDNTIVLSTKNNNENLLLLNK